ncbi:MAG: signal peptidase I, partial [Acidobacteriota bacterium]
IADWNDVPTGSMRPSILEGDRIAVNKLAYGLKFPFTGWQILEWSDPQRGEVIVFWSEDGTRFVKRVIGVSGDRIELREGRLLVNGVAATYSRVDSIDGGRAPAVRESLDGASWNIAALPHRSDESAFGPVTVPDRHVFVMGDNRDNSLDSHSFGFIDRERIAGRVVGIAISLDPDRWYWPRWHRFFANLD